MKKTVLTMILVVCMAVSMLSAAGQKESDASASETAEQEQNIIWWDHYLPLVPLHQEIWDSYMEEHDNVSIEYTQYDPNKLSEALQLSFRSKQSPDIFPNVMGVPDSKLYHDGWFSPMELGDTDLRKEIKDVLFEGYTMFDGEIYSFPIFSNLNHPASTWFNKEMVVKAGYDEDDIPVDYKSLRKLAADVTEAYNGEKYGAILPIKFIPRMNDTIDDMAMAAGAPGPIDWKTGNYTYDSSYYEKVFDFFIGMYEDGSVHPASINLDMRQARERWVAEEAALVLDGSWNIGVVVKNFPEFTDKVGVSALPVPDIDNKSAINRGPAPGTFWISSQTENAETATEILLGLTEDEYFIKLAERMDQPPLIASAVEKADVHETYKEVVSFFTEEMRYAPDPVLKNSNVSLVYAEMRDIHPNPAEILQGVFSGAVDDYRKELTKYNEAMTKERNRAIEKVQNEGVDVSLEDWIFPNWISGENYTSDMYQ